MVTKTKKTTTVAKKTAANTVKKTVAETTREETAKPKKIVKLDDSVLIDVKSNTHGELIFINPRTGDRTAWEDCGDVQTITMGDLRAMKGTQRSFYENQWIYIIGVAEDGYNDVSAEDICKSLMVTQYYKNVVDPDHYDEMFKWPVNEIRDYATGMSAAGKTNLLVAANTAIKDGSLDSLRVISALEEALNCELDRPE